MSNKQIIGRYFFEGETVSRQNYLQILKDYFYPIMRSKRLNNTVIFREDKASPRFSNEICTWLNEKFNGRWIRSDDPISWTAHSTDLMLFDYFSMEIH